MSFIEKALENAARAIRQDDSIQIEPDIDRDTRGIPGAPDIARTIFSKIEKSSAFVCDVSIINRDAVFPEGHTSPPTTPRPTPNPNVLIELGYALSTLGSSRVILTFNLAYGDVEQLPFDLKTKRIIKYNMPHKLDEGESRSIERKNLERSLELALREILRHLESQDPTETDTVPKASEITIEAIQGGRPNQTALIGKYIEWLMGELVALAPDFSKESEPDELLMAALQQSTQLVLDFSNVAETIAIYHATDAAHAIYEGFTPILERYSPPLGFSGQYRNIDFDYFKFLGHELFVMLFSFLIRENLWELIADLLEDDIYVGNQAYSGNRMMSFEYVSQYIELFAYRKRRLQLNQISLHADTLKARHTEAQLAHIVPLRQFMEADYFLFLRSQVREKRLNNWFPWSTLYMRNEAPAYLQKAKRAKNAKRLLRPLGVKTVEDMRQRLAETGSTLEKVFGFYAIVDPLAYIDLDKLGTEE